MGLHNTNSNSGKETKAVNNTGVYSLHMLFAARLRSPTFLLPLLLHSFILIAMIQIKLILVPRTLSPLLQTPPTRRTLLITLNLTISNMRDLERLAKAGCDCGAQNPHLGTVTPFGKKIIDGP
jgi:hypothetical protein